MDVVGRVKGKGISSNSYRGASVLIRERWRERERYPTGLEIGIQMISDILCNR